MPKIYLLGVHIINQHSYIDAIGNPTKAGIWLFQGGVSGLTVEPVLVIVSGKEAVIHFLYNNEPSKATYGYINGQWEYL